MDYETIKPGYICPKTNRVAVNVKVFVRSALFGTVAAYWYNPEAEEYGLEAWRLIDGIDPHTQDESLDIWFVYGKSKIVPPESTIFLSVCDS